MHVLITADVEALDAYLTRFERATRNLPRAERDRIAEDLRRDTLAAAEEVGMSQALLDLGDPDELAAEYGGQPAPDRRTTRRLVVALVATLAVAVVLVGGQRWYYLASNPTLTVATSAWDSAYFSESEMGMAVATGRTDPTVVGVSILNQNSFAVTVASPDDPGGDGPAVWFAPSAVDGTSIDYTIGRTGGPRRVAIAPGAQMVMYVEVDPCRYLPGPAVYSVGPVDLRVTALGLTTTQMIDLGLSIGVTGC